MGNLISLFVKGLFNFAGGVALTSMIDKFFPDKLPAGSVPLSPATSSTGVNWVKVIIFIVVGAIATIVIKFIGKKLNVKILK